MTRKQAIENIQTIKKLYTWSSGADEALDMAIQALEQEPSGDVVSRKVFEQVIWERDVAIAELKELGYRFGEKPPMGIWKVIEQEPVYCDRNICLKNEYSGIGCEDCEVTKSQEPCEDAISREELLKAIDTWDRFGVDDTNSLFRLDNLSLPHYVAYIHYDDVVKCIKGMPSVKPQGTGHCEDCKYFHKLPYHADTLGKCVNHWGFCPKGDWYCADFEPQESEDKE